MKYFTPNTRALFHHASMIVATHQRRRIEHLQNGALRFVCASTFKVQLSLIYNVSSKSISMTLIWPMTMSNFFHWYCYFAFDIGKNEGANFDVDPESNTTTKFIMPVLEK